MNWEWHSARSEDGLNNGSIFHERFPGQVYVVAKAPRYMSEEEWKKTAPVLSAAPEMLAALEELCKGFDSIPCAAWTPGMHKAVDAIAKARGDKIK